MGLLSRLDAINRLTGGVAHEVKNPLNSIAARLALLDSMIGEDSPEAAEKIRVIGEEVERLDRVVRTGAAFARDEDVGIGRGGLTEEEEEFLHGRTGANEFTEDSAAAQLPLEPFLVFPEAVVSHGTVEQDTKCARPDGLLHKPKGAALVDGGESGIDAAKGGEDNDGGSARDLVQAAQQLHSIHAGHHDVGDDGVGFEQREFVESFLTVGSRLGNEAPTFHHARDGGPLVGFVIDDQHASSPLRIHRLFQLSRQPELSYSLQKNNRR